MACNSFFQINLSVLKPSIYLQKAQIQNRRVPSLLPPLWKIAELSSCVFVFQKDMSQLFCIDLAFHNEADPDETIPAQVPEQFWFCCFGHQFCFVFQSFAFCLPSQWIGVGCVLHTFTCVWLQTIYYLVSEISVGTIVLFTQLYVCRISAWYYVVLDSSEFSLLCDIPLWVYHLFFHSSVDRHLDSFQYFSFLKDTAVDFLRLFSISLHVQMFLCVTAQPQRNKLYNQRLFFST